jgi:outer membrane protein assembly factor BamA
MRASVLRSVRLFASLAFLALWAAPVRAQSVASQYVGRPIEDIRLFVENRPTTEAAIVDLIAVKTGEALSIAAVRESIAHIYSLGRFQDVQVEGAQAPGGGVALRFNLIPFHSIQRIDFTGTLGLSSGELRSAVVDRYGASPPIGRIDAAVRTLQQWYADRGYLRSCAPDVHHRCGAARHDRPSRVRARPERLAGRVPAADRRGDR